MGAQHTHVVFLKEHTCFLMVDEFVARPGVVSGVQWSIHSWNQFALDKENRTFLLERGASSLEGHFMYHEDGFLSLAEGWDPPPFRTKPDAQWHQQYHLRFTISEMHARQRLGVVLCPGHASLPRARVVCTRSGNAEVAQLGDDLLVVNQGRTMEYDGLQTDAHVLLFVSGHRYEIRDTGIGEISPWSSGCSPSPCCSSLWR